MEAATGELLLLLVCTGVGSELVRGCCSGEARPVKKRCRTPLLLLLLLLSLQKGPAHKPTHQE